MAGTIGQWIAELPRIAAMGFDWVYVNPFHYPGFSGSLYAVKDYLRLNPLFEDGHGLNEFTEAAAQHGLKVMMDLVINHTSKDALLVESHPDWFRRNADGSLKSPGAVDPDEPTRITEWGDLAELDYSDPDRRLRMGEYWLELVEHYTELGFAGFRCDAAYQVPADVWAAIIGGSDPHLHFAAETLGCTPEQIAALGQAGFHSLFNSAKWWDFQAPWLLEQYDLLRGIAPSIAFPESHDTERLPGDEGAHRRMALFAACFSAGWMMPMGYEWGFTRKLDVVHTRPGDREQPRFDISPFIAQLNRVKAEIPALNVEGPQSLLPGPALLRRTPDGSQSTLLMLGEGADVTGFREILSTPEGRLLAREGEAVEWDRPGILILAVSPCVDCGRFPVKREVGDVLEVTADILKDGHDKLAARVLWRERNGPWQDVPMGFQDNDRWIGKVPLLRNTRVDYTVEAWPDTFETWRDDLGKKRAAGQAVNVELVEGRMLLNGALPRIQGQDRERLEKVLADLEGADDEVRADILASNLVRGIMARWPDRSGAVRHDRVYQVVVDRVPARFAAWYEIMARSQGTEPGRSATFKECIARLPDIAAMGFDVLYLLPIHPIGLIHRKGPDNSLVAGPDDPGSPYAIASHTAIHHDLGTLDDFRALMAAAKVYGMELALDFAIQCAPDHPWIKQHPEWFTWRPDGTIKYAENPPKKYQDIVNVNFHGPHSRELWNALLDVVRFWAVEGVRIFRVDNPHTKPIPFWEWLIRSIQDEFPDTIFLSEAFTRPKLMRALAKAGFTQSYTYFTWRNFKAELTDYLEELSQGEARDYMRPHFWPTTPDILPPFLQNGGRAAFRIRLVLAATLSPLYGIYNGYELCEAAGIPGKEEYLHSEKYQFKVWDWDRPGHIKDDIARINAIRRANPPLQELENLRFHQADDDSVLFYGKGMIFVAVNLDPFDAREAVLTFPLDQMGVPPGETWEAEELLTGRRHLWRGARQRVRLDPDVNPAVIYRVTVWASVDYRTPCF